MEDKLSVTRCTKFFPFKPADVSEQLPPIDTPRIQLHLVSNEIMPFSFLNPWFLLAALALGVPVWLHLRRKQETNLFRFSALGFLDDSPTPKRSPFRLRDLILFALRAFALLLVVAAFAWPYLRANDTAPIKESRVYILDNTMSHQAKDAFIHDRDQIFT